MTVNSSSFCVLLQARHLGASPFFFFFNARVQTIVVYVRPFPRSGFLSGAGLNAKIDLKSFEMAGNESKINKRNHNFDHNFN